MFMHWLNKYHQNVYITENNVQIKCNSNQNILGILLRPRKSYDKFMWRCKRPNKAKATLILTKLEILL